MHVYLILQTLILFIFVSIFALVSHHNIYLQKSESQDRQQLTKILGDLSISILDDPELTNQSCKIHITEFLFGLIRLNQTSKSDHLFHTNRLRPNQSNRRPFVYFPMGVLWYWINHVRSSLLFPVYSKLNSLMLITFNRGIGGEGHGHCG